MDEPALATEKHTDHPLDRLQRAFDDLKKRVLDLEQWKRLRQEMEEEQHQH